MRCAACDRLLRGLELSRKDLHGKYLDMCDKCYETIRNDVPSFDGEDYEQEDMSGDFDEDQDELV